MAGHADGQSWGTVVGDPDLSEVSTLVMPLSAISGVTLLAPPAGEPLASIPGARAADGQPVQLLIVTAALEPTLIRRIRVECTELEAILTDIDPALVLPVLDHGVDEGGRPYLMLPRPGVELAEAGVPSMTTVVTAARAAAAGLDALAARRIIGPPPGLWLTATGGVVLGTPLPPVLIEVDATLGTGTGHEPPEVLGGAEWTPAGQVYSLASQLWTLLSGQSP